MGGKTQNPVLSWAIGAFMFCLAAVAADLQAQSNDAAGPAGSNGDYQRLMSDGALLNSQGRSQEAERVFSRALEVCLARSVNARTACIDPLLRLGLELSNQSRFEEADTLFRRANGMARAAKSPLNVSRYLIYRAMDLANRRQFQQASRLARAANARYKTVLEERLGDAGAGRVAKQTLNSIFLELAHGLFVQAGIAKKLGNHEPARRTIALANEIMERVNGLPSWWRSKLKIAPNLPASRAQKAGAENVGDNKPVQE